MERGHLHMAPSRGNHHDRYGLPHTTGRTCAHHGTHLRSLTHTHTCMLALAETEPEHAHTFALARTTRLCKGYEHAQAHAHAHAHKTNAKKPHSHEVCLRTPGKVGMKRTRRAPYFRATCLTDSWSGSSVNTTTSHPAPLSRSDRSHRYRIAGL